MIGAMAGEFAFIERLRARLPDPPAGVVGIGDDCAVLADGRLFAVDSLVAGTHFDLRWCTPADAGWKAVAVNVSDIAAMGGRPEAAVVAVTLPPGEPGLADAVGDGLVEAATELGVALVGGDTTSGPVLSITVAVLGRVPDGRAPVLRRGASVGDTVFVTGPLGLATQALDDLAAGRTPSPPAAARLHRPWPRVADGEAAAAGGATAMIDVSDGLSADIGHLCDASGVAVGIEQAAVPRPDGLSIERALTGGDDYELCFTAPDRARVDASFAAAELPAPHAVGAIIGGDRRLLLLTPDSFTDLPTGGWEHDIG
jgi:thiamine-monophosphate kinase